MIKSDDFVKNATTPDNIAYMVIHFFDELMVLYNIIGQREDIHISSNIEGPILFNLKMTNVDEANRLLTSMGGTILEVFGCNYAVNMTRNRNIVHTMITRAS